jgi:signal transduction histidine kinase
VCFHLAEEAERQRIAEMLHEDLQQLLVAARMQLVALCRTQDAAEREPISREIADVLERSFKLTRSLSVELAPPVLHELGLAAALEWLAALSAFPWLALRRTFQTARASGLCFS